MRKAVEKRIMALVEAMEAQGYLIGCSRDGKGAFISMPDTSPPEICAMMELNIVRRWDQELDAAMLPFLQKHRPYEHLERRVMERAATAVQ